MASEEKSEYLSALQNWRKALTLCKSFSRETRGSTGSGRQYRVHFLSSKLLAHAMSLEKVIKRPAALAKKRDDEIFDHHSMAAMARVISDAALMTLYLSQREDSIDEWNLKRSVMYLHDLSNRRRFLKVLNKKDVPVGHDDLYRSQKEKLTRDIKEFAERCGRDDVDELVKGQRVFIDGVRDAVRKAGWDVDTFEFYSVYFSNFIHSHPVSFMRAKEHKVDFYTVSDAQYAVGLVALEASTFALNSVHGRLVEFLGTDGDPLANYFDEDGSLKFESE